MPLLLLEENICPKCITLIIRTGNFKKIINSHDEKELLKLSIFIKEGMKQLN